MQDNASVEAGYYRPTNLLEKILRTFHLYKRAFLTKLTPPTHLSRTRTILMIVPHVDRIGGYERQAMELSRVLTEAEHLVVILSRDGNDFPERELKNGFLIHRYSGTAAIVLLKSVWFMIINHQRFDVVHVHGITGFSFVMARIALLLRMPVCLKPATRDDLNALAVGKSWKKSLYGKWISRIPHWIAISEELREEIASKGISATRIHRIPNFVDTAKFRSPEPAQKLRLRTKFHVGGGPLIYLFLGRLEERKGVDLLLQAWKTRPCGILWIVGSGPDEPHFKQFVASEAVPSVHFFAATSSPIDYFQAADVFVLPSRKEGFPNVLLEAMSCGLPCIASAIGGVVDVLRPDQEGLLVQAGSVESLSEALGRVAVSESDRKRWSVNARETAAHYDRMVIVRKYLDLYSQMLQ